MTLSDGDVALLARQAVDAFCADFDLGSDVDIAIDPAAPMDPYRLGHQAWLVWPLLDGRRTFSIRLDSGSTPAEALAQLLEQLSEHGSDPARDGARPFPACPGHPHPAGVSAAGTDVVLICPDSGDVVGRIIPDLP